MKKPDPPILRSNPDHVLAHAHYQEQQLVLHLQYLQSTVYCHQKRHSSHHHDQPAVLVLDLGQLSLIEGPLVKRNHALNRTRLATTFLL